jgi:hypothetical protein
MVVADGAALGSSNCIQLGMLEHAARLIPQAAIATIRFMINTVRSSARWPRPPARRVPPPRHPAKPDMAFPANLR